MKYEFHVGDYVEMADGKTGWVDYIDYIKTPQGYYSIRVKMTTKDTCSEFHGYEYDLNKYFNRIGRYDLTKKEKKKIMKLSEDDSWLTFRNTNKANVNLCYIIKRINELVDAVNLLLDKSTES